MHTPCLEKKWIVIESDIIKYLYVRLNDLASLTFFYLEVFRGTPTQRKKKKVGQEKGTVVSYMYANC